MLQGIIEKPGLTEPLCRDFLICCLEYRAGRMYIHMKKLSNEELSFFCMELSLLLHAGIGVEEGLRLLA